MYYSFTTSTKKELQCELICDVDCILHLHSHFEMVFALDGCVEVSVDDNCYSLQKNEMALITPYSSHSFKTVSSSRIIVIEFPTSYIREYKKLFLGKVLGSFLCLYVLRSLFWLLFLEEKRSFPFFSFYEFGENPKNKGVFGKIPKKGSVFGKTEMLGNIYGGLYEKERL